MNQWLMDHLPEALATMLAGTATFFGKRVWGFGGRIAKLDKRVTILEANQIDCEEVEGRVAELERTATTREDLEDLRTSLTTTISDAAKRSEDRLDRIYEILGSRDVGGGR